jgi:uncharacterized membrane protein YadS
MLGATIHDVAQVVGAGYVVSETSATLPWSSSCSAIAALGWRHVATVTGTTVVILVAVMAGLLIAN